VPPLVTLTSDFGTGSPYVAAMKAAVLAACPDALPVDISHAVDPFDVRAGAFVLWVGSSRFPAGCVHLAVVDPGVGSDRHALAIEAGASFYVGPDNGLFDYVLAGAPSWRAVALARPQGASRTFEGRDVFAPAAGALANGVPLATLGLPVRELAKLPASGPAVVWVDGFGNLVTDLEPPVRPLRINARLVSAAAATYAEAPEGEPFVYVGSMGRLEVGVKRARADALLGAGVGSAIELA
jgi:S-adenosylmethionine hydrolase